mmetsp:Transcript_14620/g.40627  ORF Transcript_14620/g.40627 Transcript_14620/m.40627 type:complete len:192 (-) Transcript_14620:300-875(-)
MKRSHQQRSQHDSTHCNSIDGSQSQVVPVFIEREGNYEGIKKRPKSGVPPLNFLIQAIMERQAGSTRTQNSTYSSSMASSIASSTVSRSSKSSNATYSSVRNLIIDRVPLDEVHVASPSHDNEDFSSQPTLSPLPGGRPLMPPPPLPTKLCDRRIGFLTSNFSPLEMTLFSRGPKSTRTPKIVGSNTERRN